MKRYLIILFIFCGLFNTVCGQSREAIIDSLVKFGVISNKQRPILQNEFKYAGNASDRVAILGGLHSIQMQKTFHIKPHTGYMMSFDFGHLNKKSQDSVNNVFRLLLDKINRAGLLTERVYTYTLKGIDSGYYVAEVQLISHLAEMSSRLEWLAPDKLLPVAAQLHQNGIVSDSSFIRLENDIKNGKIESPFQLNEYCTLDRTFNLAKYADDPKVWLEQIHRDIAAMLPNLNFTNFNYTTSPDTALSKGSVQWLRIKVSLTCNGRVYKYTSLTLDYKGKQGKFGPNDIIAKTYYRIFNKILTDQQSPLRLHSIMYSRGDDSENLALIALREEQTEIFMKYPCLSYMLLGLENYDNTLTSARIDTVIAGWTKIGLFAHLSNAEIVKATDNAQAGDLFSIDGLLNNFPGVVYPLMSSLSSRGHLYDTLLSRFAEITHGAFNPTKITQKKKNGGIRLQYLSNGKIHSYTFKTATGFLDDGFSTFMKSLAGENNLPGNFYQLKYAADVIYLTKQQYDYIVNHSLLDLGQQ